MCDTLASLASSAARGAALFAKNSDRERNEAQVLELHPARAGAAGRPLRVTYISIPDVARTHACLLSRPFWMWGAEMGANAHGVVIGNEALHAKTPAQRRRALIGMDLVRLGLERGATAAEARDVIIDLLERHGQGGDCGHLGRFYYNNGFIIADPTEAYVLETAGREWVWRRVAAQRALSNAYSIAADYDAISPGLRRAERYDVAAALIDEARDAVSFGRGRCARGQALLDRAAPRLTPAAMMAILRDHGEAPDWTPANTRDRTLCMHASNGPRRSQSVASMVSELRPGRTVHWLTGTSAPCTSVFKPFVFGVAAPPFGASPTDRADPESRWWRHERVHRAMLADFTPALAAIAPERDALEASFQARIDQAFDAGDLDGAIASCWAEADAAEARWRTNFPRPGRSEATPAHRRSWARLNHVAGWVD
ncbi:MULTISPECIES: C69 family dipeptidase [unclassified Phenylobacterium]|jgi:secernin|uniref:C69 family dipeptidase n=1 Tax=unclassified Phenylobacterium TaxID=2640670 RepID=UPI00083B94AB|nr:MULTISPECIES: C69 family dipeptidase [unclassified Phenylobacterium]